MKKHDETVPGGRYMTARGLVDANGNPIQEKPQEAASEDGETKAELDESPIGEGLQEAPAEEVADEVETAETDESTKETA